MPGALDPSTGGEENPRDEGPAAGRARRAQGVLARLRSAAPQALARFPVDAAYLYGSMARGTPLPDSDVDVALLTSRRPWRMPAPSATWTFTASTRRRSTFRAPC
jgi:hypothetical protein